MKNISKSFVSLLKVEFPDHLSILFLFLNNYGLIFWRAVCFIFKTIIHDRSLPTFVALMVKRKQCLLVIFALLYWVVMLSMLEELSEVYMPLDKWVPSDLFFVSYSLLIQFALLLWVLSSLPLYICEFKNIFTYSKGCLYTVYCGVWMTNFLVLKISDSYAVFII